MDYINYIELEARKGFTMKKYHDQVLRNIYKLVVPNDDGEYNDPDIHAELLESAALPAHCYVAGFKSIRHLIDVCTNDQNRTMKDLKQLSASFLTFLELHSYKQHRMPQEFHSMLVETFKGLSKEIEIFYFTRSNHRAVQAYILETFEKYDETYGWAAHRLQMENYRLAHPELGYYYEYNKRDDVEYQDAWDKYWAYCKSTRFPAVNRFYSVFYSLKNQFVDRKRG